MANSKLSQWTLALLRIVLGVIFTYHGYLKLFVVGGLRKLAYPRIKVIMVVAILILGTISIAAAASAVTLNPGDIIVTDLNEVGGPGSVFRVNPVIGVQTTICSACISDPAGVVIDANGDIIVADVTSSLTHPAPHPGSIVRVNPATGAVTTISSGGSLVDPIGVAIDANGDIIVVDEDGFGGPGGIIRVNPFTGAQTTISSGGLFVDPAFVAIDSTGDFIVSEQTASGSAIIRVNPATGAQTLISSGTSGLSYGKAIDANGDIISGSGGSIVRVNPATGAVTTISSGGLLTQVFGVNIDANGNIIIANFGPPRIIRVNPFTGAQTLISSGGSFINPFGVALVPSDVHDTILEEVQNIEGKLDGNVTSLITQIFDAIGSIAAPDLSPIMTVLASIQTSLTDILNFLQHPEFGLPEIKREVSFIEENMKIGATKSLSVTVPATSTFVIGAPDFTFPSPNVIITNPFDPVRDSNIKICVDATSLADNSLNQLMLKLDVSGDGDFSIRDTIQGAGKGNTLGDVDCFEVAARDFQLVITNTFDTSKDVEVAIIWNTGNRILP